MLFNSLDFIIFFPIVSAIFFALRHRFRWIWLLVASCYFYMAFVPAYILILVVTIIIDYVSGLVIEPAKGAKRRLFLIISLVANIGMLAVFKYYNFLIDNTEQLSAWMGIATHLPHLAILLPIGLSFHTFQSMSYTIEVYRGNQPAERHFGIFSLYVLFYPQLVAGPIERPQNLLHQFHGERHFSYQNASDGLKLMLWGMFKKIVVADRLAMIVDYVYNNPSNYDTGLPLLLATYAFSLQIYCDFSGYSDIAIGAAQFMGYDLMRNFNRPYLSQSIPEFWRRWHISLSTWFKDYLYISLGGNRVSIPRWYFNLFFVFLVSGLWHGASWNFVIWGALHGFYQIFGLITANLRHRFNTAIGLVKMPRLHTAIKWFVTVNLAAFAWIFFRAVTFNDAWHVITNIYKIDIGFLIQNASSLGTGKRLLEIGAGRNDLIIMIVTVAVMFAVEIWQGDRHDVRSLFAEQPKWRRWAIYYALFIAIVIWGVFRQSSFIYFQF